MDNELAYFAGLFDGEGCVHAGIHKAGFVTVTVSVAMLRREPLEVCVRLFGGVIRSSHRKGRDVFSWSLQNGNAVEVLQAIASRCLIKNEVAALALPIAQSMRRNIPGPGLPLSERQRRLKAVNAIRAIIGRSEIDVARQAAYLKPRTHGAIPVIRSDGVVFNTQGHAALSVGRTQTAISFAIKHGTNCAGYKWEFIQ